MKKSFYAKMKKEEDEKEAEWASKYRDRVSSSPPYIGDSLSLKDVQYIYICKTFDEPCSCL